MSAPWYEPAVYGWIFGTFLGVAIGLLGGLVGLQASGGEIRRGTAKLVVIMLLISAVLFLSGLAALALNQPRGVWYSLFYPGSIGLSALGALLVVISRVRGHSSRR